MSPVLVLSSLLLLLVACAPGARADIYDRCRLAKKLMNVYDFPVEQLSTWICIISHESKFDLHAIHKNDDYGNTDYGLFQINSRYWCDQGDDGCGVFCNSLLGSLTKSAKCAQTIYDKRGFWAWTMYDRHCKGNTYPYIEDCRLFEDCWTTGCQPDSWRDRGCAHEGRKQLGYAGSCYTPSGESGLKFTCCT